jgi:hypothetical protein
MPSINSSVRNQSDYMLLKQAHRASKPAKPNYNSLNINLITKLDLTGVCVIKNNATNECPSSIELPAGLTTIEYVVDPQDPSQVTEQFKTANYMDDYRYTNYTIDPSGQFIGNLGSDYLVLN